MNKKKKIELISNSYYHTDPYSIRIKYYVGRKLVFNGCEERPLDTFKLFCTTCGYEDIIDSDNVCRDLEKHGIEVILITKD